jgi:hypothetical protein
MTKTSKAPRGGKGATTARAAATVKAEWDTSKFRSLDLTKLEGEGFVAAGEVRVPGSEATPRPLPDERVCFAAFMQRGVSLPVHAFLRGLLHAYGIQLHDLTPNSILQASCFVTLCECFLGVFPHWGLWKKIFDVKRCCERYQTGGVQFSVKSDVVYFDLQQKESVAGWRTRWFYIKDEAVTGQQFGLPPFDLTAVVKRTRAWRHELSERELAEVEPMYNRVIELKRAAGREVTGLHLITLFIRRCVQPLQHRSSPMWRFSGGEDPTRVRQEDYSTSELETRVQRLTKIAQKDWKRQLLECPVRPFELGCLPGEVCARTRMSAHVLGLLNLDVLSVLLLLNCRGMYT